MSNDRSEVICGRKDIEILWLTQIIQIMSLNFPYIIYMVLGSLHSPCLLLFALNLMHTWRTSWFFENAGIPSSPLSQLQRRPVLHCKGSLSVLSCDLTAPTTQWMKPTIALAIMKFFLKPKQFGFNQHELTWTGIGYSCNLSLIVYHCQLMLWSPLNCNWNHINRGVAWIL